MACAAAVLSAVAYGLMVASRWPLVHDAPLMHYVVFLMAHGFAPYRDLVEINMPGSYMQEWVVMHTFGGEAHGWFAWDMFTGLTAILAGAWIAGPDRHWAGGTGGGLAYLLHLSDGAWDLGQRDWVIAVLLLLAFAATLETRRGRSNAWMALATCLCAAATTIKPLAIVTPFLLLGAVLFLRWRKGEPLLPPILWSLAGVVPPSLATALFLAHWGVWREFLATLRGIVAYYAGLQALSLPVLLHLALPRSILPFAAGGVALFLVNRSWRSSPSLFLLAGTLLGFAFFFLQRKGWTYHRYTALAFLFVWFMCEVATALRGRLPAVRYAAAALLVGGTLGVCSRALQVERANVYPMDTLTHLQQDLRHFGEPQLSGRVQCLDMALGGCINALYRMQLVQATGFLYDFPLFPVRDTKLTRQLQARFLGEITAKPPKLIVLSAQNWPSDTFGYDQLSRWPAFHQFLQDRYTVASSYQSDPQRPSVGYELFRLKERQ